MYICTYVTSGYAIIYISSRQLRNIELNITICLNVKVVHSTYIYTVGKNIMECKRNVVSNVWWESENLFWICWFRFQRKRNPACKLLGMCTVHHKQVRMIRDGLTRFYILKGIVLCKMLFNPNQRGQGPKMDLIFWNYCTVIYGFLYFYFYDSNNKNSLIS